MKTIPLTATLALGAVALAASATPPRADAAPDPCAASQIARTVGIVATDTATYLEAHPDSNQALTAFAARQPGPQTLAAVKTYLDAHPQTAADLGALQRPLVTLSARCRLPVNLPALLGLLQSAPGSTDSPAATDATTGTVLR